MIPTFPRRNIAINWYIEFRSGANIYEFASHYDKPEAERSEVKEESLNGEVNFIYERFDSMMEEIHQVLHTSNYFTIRYMFDELKVVIEEYDLYDGSIEGVADEIIDWNNKKSIDYQDKIAEQSTKFWNKPERTKYKHLEKYEELQFDFLGLLGPAGEAKKVTVTNKNFYCVDFLPETIREGNGITIYSIELDRMASKFRQLLEPLIKRYDDGEFKPEKENKPVFDRWFEKIKNNKILAGLGIFFVLLLACLELVDLGYSLWQKITPDETDSTINENLNNNESLNDSISTDTLNISSSPWDSSIQ